MRFILLLLLTTSCLAQKPMQSSVLDQYLAYLTGDFDNRQQVADEQRNGTQTHPFAQHITRIITNRVKGLPANNRAVYVLEESYYKYPNQDTLVKPYIFRFEETAGGNVRLQSIAIPERIDKKTFRNSNPNWSLLADELKESPSFKPADYKRTERGFYLKAINDLPNTMRFTLEETVGDGFLDVMELLEKEGKRLTPYSTPLLYKRVNK